MEVLLLFSGKSIPSLERFFVFDFSEYRYALNMRKVVFHQFLSDGFAPIVSEEEGGATKMIPLMSISLW